MLFVSIASKTLLENEIQCKKVLKPVALQSIRAGERKMASLLVWFLLILISKSGNFIGNNVILSLGCDLAQYTWEKWEVGPRCLGW